MFLVIRNERLICTPEVQDTNAYVAPSCSSVPFVIWIHHRTRIATNLTPSSHFFFLPFFYFNSFPVSSLSPTVFFSATSLCSQPVGKEVQDYCPARQHSVPCQKSNWCWSYFMWSANAVWLLVLSVCTVQNSFWKVIGQGGRRMWELP